MYYATNGGREFANNLELLHGFTEKIIFDKMQSSKTPDSPSKTKRRLAFLDLLLRVSEDGEVLSLPDIREEVDTFMFEGK